MRKRDLYILAFVTVMAVGLGIGIMLTETVTTGSWGLSFQTEGQPPVGPANSAVLARFDAAFLGDTTKPVLYLTFDAGYENGCTAQILDALKKHEVSAAFFLVGNYMERNPELVKRMVEEGHDCSEVLVQLAAVRSAIENTGKVILQDHMRHCMVDAVEAGDDSAINDLCDAIDKFMK